MRRLTVPKWSHHRAPRPALTAPRFPVSPVGGISALRRLGSSFPSISGGLFDQPPVKVRDFRASVCRYKILVQSGKYPLGFDSMSLSQARTPVFRAPGAELSRVRTRDYRGPGHNVVTLKTTKTIRPATKRSEPRELHSSCRSGDDPGVSLAG